MAKRKVRQEKLPNGVTILKSGHYNRRYTINGRRHSDSDADLDVLMARTNARINAARDAMPYNKHKYTVEDFYVMWTTSFKMRAIRGSTLNSNDSKFYTRIAPMFGQRLLESISSFEVNDFYYEMLDDGLHTGYANDVLSLFSQIFKAAMSMGYLQHNPCEAVRFRPAGDDRGGARALSALEVKTVFTLMRGSEYYDVLKTLLLTGLRIGEAVSLRFSDIKGSSIRVKRTLSRTYSAKFDRIANCIHTPKTNKGMRTIVLTEELSNLIEGRRALYEKRRSLQGDNWGACCVIEGNLVEDEHEVVIDDFIFMNKNGEPYNPTTINTFLAYHVNKYNNEHPELPGLETITCHDFRDTFASMAFNSGMEPTVLQKLLGHSNFQTTSNYYVDVSHEKKNTNIQRMLDDYKEILHEL